MLKNTHIATSTSLVLIFILWTYFFTTLWGGNFFPLYPFLLLPILAVLPDSDHPESYLNKKFKPLSVISKIAWHRTWSHDLFTLAVVAGLLYWFFWWLFGHYDIPTTTISEGFFWWLKFFIYSPNYLWIFIALAGHTFWDFLTKWSVKFFYWAEWLNTKVFKLFLLKITIGLPFFILHKVQDILNKAKWNLFPTTWSDFEKKVYAGIFNGVNFLLLMLFAFYMPVFTSLKNTFAHLSNGTTLSWRVLFFLIIFFGISIWYFFALSVWKLKFYAKVAKELTLYILWMILGLVVIYLMFTFIPFLSSYAWIGMLLYIALCIATYKKMIKLEFGYFNVIVNEILLILIYTIILWTWIFAYTKSLKVQPISNVSFEKLKETISTHSSTVKNKIDEVVPESIKDKIDEVKTNKKNNKTKVNKKKEKAPITDPDFFGF